MIALLGAGQKEMALVFIDESGNKFDEDMFKHSPFFIYAWVLLTEEQENNISLRISDLLRREGVPRGSELHAIKMWKSTRGLKRFNEVMQIIHDSGARAYITFTEKRFEICVLICETYLDYLDDHVNILEKYIDPQKRAFRLKLMNVIYHSVTDDFLYEFREACVQDDIELIRGIGVRLARLLVLHPDGEISKSAELFERGLKTPFRFGRRIPDSPKNVHLITSHSSLFFMVLNVLESELASLELTAKIIRDQDSVHGEVLDKVYDFMVNDLQLKNLAGCVEMASKDSIGLQLADLVAGATERVLRAKIHKKELAQTNRSIWASLRLCLPLGTWTYQQTSDSCEVALDDLWDYGTLARSHSNGPSDPNNPLRCNCGVVIIGGEIRDYYSHVIKDHPTSEILGGRCQICSKLIPLWLGACHDVIDHHIQPPFLGDFYRDMQDDYMVLQAVEKSNLTIIEPDDSNS